MLISPYLALSVIWLILRVRHWTPCGRKIRDNKLKQRVFVVVVEMAPAMLMAIHVQVHSKSATHTYKKTVAARVRCVDRFKAGAYVTR